MRKFYPHLKILLTVLLIVFVISSLTGGDISSADMQTVAGQVVKGTKFEQMSPAENRIIKRFYGLNANDYESVVLYAPGDNMDVHELLLVKLKDLSQQKTVEDAVGKRLETQLNSFEGYGAEQVALLNKSVTIVKGNYIFFMVDEDAAKAQKAFLKSL